MALVKRGLRATRMRKVLSTCVSELTELDCGVSVEDKWLTVGRQGNFL